MEIEWKDTSFKLGMSVNPAPTLLTCTSAASSRRATSRIRRGRPGTKISSPTYAQEGAQGNGWDEAEVRDGSNDVSGILRVLCFAAERGKGPLRISNQGQISYRNLDG